MERLEKSLARALIGAVLFSGALALMSFETFNSKVSWSCFNETGVVRGAGVPTPLPHSIESFLDLVRQVEGSRWAVDAADTAALLLRRFSIDFVDHQRLPDGERFVVNSGRERKSAIFEALLKTSEPPEFNEAALSEDRKCALFAMLSHALNSGAEKKESALLRTVQEQGVVNIAGNSTLAVTMGHVLRGIVASKYSVRDSAENLLKLLKPYSDMAQGHSVIDHIYGPTLAGHLGTLSSWSNTKVPIIGASGFWKTSMCPREFMVARKPGKLTDAEILGALDGFILGTILKRISKDRPRRLSHLLDMYYSRRGIRELLPEFPKGLSYCTRKEAVARLLSPARLEEQVLVMARLFAKLDNAEMKHTAAKTAILPMLKSFHAKLDRLLRTSKKCAESDDKHLPTCDTRSDILILLDPIPGNTIYDNYQKKLAGYMAERFLKKSDHSAISISASELSEDASNLVLTYSNRGSRYVSPSCAIDTMVDKGCSQCTEVDIWRAVNNSWNTLHSLQSAAHALTPSKVIVYFKFSSFRASAHDIHSVVQDLRRTHKDLIIFAVGPNTDILKTFQYDPKDAVVVIPNSIDEQLLQQIARELTEEICQAPVVINCQECTYSSTSHVHNSLEDYQTPLTIKHWSFYPRTFKNVPLEMNVTIEAHHLPIRVCLDRQNTSTVRIPFHGDFCRETGNKAKAIQYNLRSLCSSKESSTCDSLYYSVEALPRKAGDAFIECTDSGCRYPDQTKITITYEIDFIQEENTMLLNLEERSNINRVTGNPSAFKNLLTSKCSNYTSMEYLGNEEHPASVTLDYFLVLLEKIEAGYPGRNMFDIAALLLHWFSTNEYNPSELQISQQVDKGQTTLEWQMLRPLGSEMPLEWKDDVLTESETCSMFLMMSHALQKEKNNESFSVERGVVRINWQADRLAVAPAKVLQGILSANLSRNHNLTHLQPESQVVSAEPTLAIDPQYAVTLGAALGVAAVQSSFQRHVGNTVGHEGTWSGTFCPARYKVKSRQEWSTYSLLRGAIDGFLLAKYTRKTMMQNVSLSELMRLYYGSSGVPQSISGIPNLSVCSRRELLYPHLRDGHLEGNVSHIAQVYSLLHYGQSSARLGLFVAMTAEEFLQRLRRDLLRNPAFCDRYPLTPEQAQCYTPGDIHIIMDADASKNKEWIDQQRRVVEYIAHYLNLGKSVRRLLHLYINKRDIDGELQEQLKNMSSASSVSCYVKSAKLSELATDNEAVVLESLQRTLSKEKYDAQDDRAVSSKTVILFKYGHLRSPTQRLKPLVPRMLQNQAGSIIAVGNNLTALSSIVRSQLDGGFYDKAVVLPDNEEAAKNVAKVIADDACRAPALLGCRGCFEHGRIGGSFEGDVPENGVIYLLISPENYGSTEHVRIKISAVNGIIKVCQQASRFLILKPDECDTAFEDHIVYEVTCASDDCHSLHLAVVGIAVKCQTMTCSPADRIKFRIAFEDAHTEQAVSAKHNGDNNSSPRRLDNDLHE